MNTPASNSVDQQPSNLNLPNILTSLRIIAIPLFAWLVLKSESQYTSWMLWSFTCFVALMITDKLDGDIARSRGLITNFGKIADPIADKALMSTALICLNITGVLPVWVTVVILVREIGITIWRMVELRNGNVVPASKGGKLKTVLQTLAVALYLLPLPTSFHYVALAVMVIAVVVTVVTGIQYIYDSFQIKKKKK
ncbi:CDP-diacylglycerol--glycerol-3-phosphate 3-phosphatidyltransferase [Corynebacterium mustelae]|uniref:CDP-diacylglycerol--glycerol-3-phosphate 3-phosphatidyltransferase n=1 Tax=Corynebacterium mustelae TaxID=571915 RepID=A0A0G3H2Y3_9CORY|nr:CDP-diacylglycerol--glycerol-3-phosphate 3-phosphatidyltransferase [Corynebacterium mustelae]AKK06153.1 CDP-diacylglycerol--glycerol-3-phosphate 3-phosphatidyltransferase [Corynebacterium mustelae]